MSANTSIEWTDRSWNPVRGCSLVSEGCRSCYAMKQAHRFSGPGKPYEGLTELGPKGPRWNGKIRLIEDALTEPLSWRKPRRIFVNSMSDLFHEDVPDTFIDRVFAVMALAPRHTFQILTKRAERLPAYVTDAAWVRVRRQVEIWADLYVRGRGSLYHAAKLAIANGFGRTWGTTWPLPKVWLGTSVENRDALGRIDELRAVPAAMRFVSFEPLLESLGDIRLDGIHWGIVGFESGPRARPGAEEWIESLIEQCDAAGTACFVKQLGARPVRRTQKSFQNFPNWVNKASQRIERGEVCIDALGRVCARGADFQRADQEGAFPVSIYAPLKLSHRKGSDMREWAEHLRVRQFPAGSEMWAQSAEEGS